MLYANYYTKVAIFWCGISFPEFLHGDGQVSNPARAFFVMGIGKLRILTNGLG